VVLLAEYKYQQTSFGAKKVNTTKGLLDEVVLTILYNTKHFQHQKLSIGYNKHIYISTCVQALIAKCLLGQKFRHHADKRTYKYTWKKATNLCKV